jgi:acetoin utilization deacetylase AcuC-like enzyme
MKGLSMNTVTIFRHPIYIEHDTGPFHPESPQRLEILYEMLGAEDVKDLCTFAEPRKAKKEEITLVHTSDHFNRVAATAGLKQSFLDADTQTSEKSFDAALYSAGALLSAVDLLMTDKSSRVFTLVRPPGHHAERARSMGFCLFNNIAIAAMYAMEKYYIKRILIIDWDLHHGNGTQSAFYDDSRVLYFSTHQYPYYPGSGDFSETGIGAGAGYTVNVPLPAGQGNGEFYSVFNDVLLPVADQFEPELVLVSAGFDIHFDDPLGGMELTPEGFASLSQIIQLMADRHAGGRLLFTLEGGYSLTGLRDSVRAVIEQLAGREQINVDQIKKGKPARSIERIIDLVKQVHKEYWTCF